jgi:hypothetical protein
MFHGLAIGLPRFLGGLNSVTDIYGCVPKANENFGSIMYFSHSIITTSTIFSAYDHCIIV